MRSLPRWFRGMLAAGALWACGAPAHADATFFDHLTQATYDVDVRPGSELRAYTGFSGVGLTGYSTPAALSGDGVILRAFPGESKTLTQRLELRFTAHSGFTFESVDFSHLLSYFHDRGGHWSQMSWVLDKGDGSPIAGSTPLLKDDVWSHGGSYSDFSQASPSLAVGRRSFDLDVNLFYVALGAPGVCGTGSGACSEISATSVKIGAHTVEAPAVPEPGSLALMLVGGCLVGVRRAIAARRSSAEGLPAP
ncbi:MAG: PEP-CTERM sorting domain-containing protein [Burkholderiales bacterium]|nr:PEP-CTERM sorting domain-containing protein [Burkholderiales bacterium]